MNKVRLECPARLLPRDKQYIKVLIYMDSTSHCLSLRRIIQDLELNVCKSTVKLALKDLGYRHCIALYYSFLEKKNKKRHLQSARHHGHMTVEDWKAYICTDKMSIKVGMERTTQD